jgi:hypothetical protein
MVRATMGKKAATKPPERAMSDASENAPKKASHDRALPERASAAGKFDPIEFSVARPLASPPELAVAFGQLIDSIGDLTGVKVDRVITPTFTSITISWLRASIPSDEWLHDVELQLEAFAACTGMHVWFRYH